MFLALIFVVLATIFQFFADGGNYQSQSQVLPDQTSVGLTLGTNVGAAVGIDASLDLSEDFKLLLLAGLKAADIFKGYSGTISTSQLYVASTLLIQLLSTRFHLQLGNSYIASCYKALLAVDARLGLDGYLTVLANFTTQVLVQQGVLTDLDAALRTSSESIILTCSRAFNLNIDLNAAVKIALSVDVGLGLDSSVEFGTGNPYDLNQGERVEIDDDLAVKIAKKFGCILKTSQQFDQAVLSGDRKAVIHSIIPAIRGSLGVKAANALAKCAG